MKYIVSFFVLFHFCQPLYASSYIDILDVVVDQKVTELADSSYKVEKFVQQIQKNIKTELSLQQVEDFLDRERSIAFFFCDQMQAKIDEIAPDGMTQTQQSFKDLQFALGAKLYVYYLECAKQKMLQQAVKNYDALNFWHNEQFFESRSFSPNNILRSLSTSDYKKRVKENIKRLEDLTEQTDSFLGLVLHNQQLLQKAMTQQEFQQNVVQAVQLQDEFLHIPYQHYETCDISLILKKSIDQISRLSVHLSAQYAQCKSPSHVVRHWQGYTLTAAAACVGAFIYMRYGDALGQGAHNFYAEHVRGAAERNFNLFGEQLNGPLHIERLDTHDNEQTVRVMVEEELRRPAPKTDQDGTVLYAWYHDAYNVFVNNIQNMPVQEPNEGNEALPPLLTFEQKKQLALERTRIILAHPERNSFRVLPAYSLKAELEMIEGKNLANNTIDEVEVAGNKILKDVHKLLGLTALIPVITVVCGSLFGLKSLYKPIAYQPIRTLVRRLELLLNDILYQPVSFEKEGHLYFLTEQLKLNVNVLTIAEQQMIDIDITALQSHTLDYAQKFNVIQRMYHTYPCLVPGTV
jgi:hypothetical protein